MKSKIFIACFAVLLFSCENTDEAAEKDSIENKSEMRSNDTEVQETAVTEIRDKIEEPETETSLDGVYSSGDGELHIMNANKNGFDYSIVMNAPDACEGTDYEGVAIYDSEGPSVYGSESIASGSPEDITPVDQYDYDKFYIRNGGLEIQMDATFSMIGMECSNGSLRLVEFPL
jgi:hypothetical protein